MIGGLIVGILIGIVLYPVAQALIKKLTEKAGKIK